MSLISDLTTLCELWNSWSDKQIGEDEKTLLRLAGDNAHPMPGSIMISSTDQTGEFVRVGNRVLLDEQDPATRVRYLDAMEKLYRRGLVRHESGKLFVLSGTGWSKTREVA